MSIITPQNTLILLLCNIKLPNSISLFLYFTIKLSFHITISLLSDRVTVCFAPMCQAGHLCYSTDTDTEADTGHITCHNDATHRD